MKRWKIFILVFMFMVPLISVFAQNSVTQKIPIGMESVQIGADGHLIVPKGAKTRMVGAQIIVEGTKEYMSRRFFEMEERFERIEKNQEEIKKEMEALKDALKEKQGMVNTKQ